MLQFDRSKRSHYSHLAFVVAGIVLITGWPSLFGQSFTRISTGIIVNDGGESEACSWGDYTNDGYLDLYVSNGLVTARKNFLYMNNGPSQGYTFTKIFDGDVVNDTSGSRSASWGDYDNDGFLDLFVGNQQGADANSRLYRNNGDGTFESILAGDLVSDGPISDGAEWIDYDNDGFLDVFTAAGGSNSNRLYRNNGDGAFVKVTEGEIVNDREDSLGEAWGDFDNDGDRDLYVANRGNNSMYLNNGDGTFTKDTGGFHIADGTQSQGANWIDYDNDGDLDLFVSNRLNSKNLLFQNLGAEARFLFLQESLGDIVNDASKFSYSTWSDYDNDGDLDLFVSNFGEFDLLGWENYLYSNNGDGTFAKIDTGVIVTDKSTSVSGAWGDYDNDGDMDLFVVNTLDANNFLYRNESGNSNNWVKVEAFGTVSNASGIGAKIRLKATIDGQEVWQLRELSGQTGLLSQNSLITHFGLREANSIDTLRVEWPAGTVDEFTDLDANQHIQVTEGGAISSVASNTAGLPAGFELSQNYPNPFNPQTTIAFQLPKAEYVKLAIYNLAGQRIRTLVADQRSVGTHAVSWDGRNDFGRAVASGVYLYRLQAGRKIMETKKMILMK